MGPTSIGELPYCVKESPIPSKMKMVVKQDHESYPKKRIEKNDIKR
jgi:hypothetical protein